MMRLKLLVILISLGFINAGWAQKQTTWDNSRMLPFDKDWKFQAGGAYAAAEVVFKDSGWRKLDLPHDWSIEDIPGTNSPFDRDAVANTNLGFKRTGVGWYRKNFMLPFSQKGKKIYIQFDAVYMNSTVWVNGKQMGVHPYGFTSFYYDITDAVYFDKPNVVAVQVQNLGMNCRWYSGSGIYRHVWLNIVNPVHLEKWGTYITTPMVHTDSAAVAVKVNVVNNETREQEIKTILRIIDNTNKEVVVTTSVDKIRMNTTGEISLKAIVNNAHLWSVETPALYKAVIEIYSNNQLMDKEETNFGIRTISFDAVNGFRLNGKAMKLKGGCIHHDNAALGAKVFERADERKLELLKASGFNAIRLSHNPPAPSFLDACDRLGFLVIDEAFDQWQYEKLPYDYHLYFNEWWKKDLENMVIRDRNHPSIIMWSIGNEIINVDKPEVYNLAPVLANTVRNLDVTRPVTAGVNNVWDDNDGNDRYFTAFDVVGYNYGRNRYKQDHQEYPGRVMVSTESYAMEAFDFWMGVEDNSWVIGDFVWTAFDYMGEASIGWLGFYNNEGVYPWNLAFCGDLDICGWKRPQSYYRDVLWNKDRISVFVKSPKLSFPTNPDNPWWSKWDWPDVHANWNWQGYEGKSLEVNIYSSCEEVELFLNNKSLGRKATNRSNKYTAIFNVPYQTGILKAVGYTGGKEINSSQLQTTQLPSQIKLSADRDTIMADGSDLSYVTVEITDKNGLRNPIAENLVKFSIGGPGTIEGVINANPISLESYQQPQRKAWQGRCLVVVKSNATPGKIKLTVSGEGLKHAVIEIESSK